VRGHVVSVAPACLSIIAGGGQYSDMSVLHDIVVICSAAAASLCAGYTAHALTE